MIKLHFSLGGEILIVKIEGNIVNFSSTETGLEVYYPIDSLGLSMEGILKEFPDLEEKPNEEMKLIAMERLKQHIKKLGNEDVIKEYIIKELTNSGYNLELIRRVGWRDQKIKSG